MESLDPGQSAAGRRVLLLAPHSDDEALGPGGSVACLTRAGARVLPVILARSAGVQGQVPPEQRREESLRCCEILGTDAPLFLDVPSSELRGDPLAAALRLAELVSDSGPFDAVLAPWPLERHPTHRASLLAGVLAAADAAWMNPAADWWGYGAWDALPAAPGVFEIDVTALRKAKTQAVAAHKSQMSMRAFGAAMASRDMAQAVFSKITGDEPRKAVERLMDMRPMIALVRAALDGVQGAARVPAARDALVSWVTAWTANSARELWADASPPSAH
ncbi:MAG: hypothetical protein DHS20C15_06110 [Planctomycetota bacterium]|nr:MAG: hypothetical protein DHS20C15_06110 [Planctomycetota bacterium]